MILTHNCNTTEKVCPMGGNSQKNAVNDTFLYEFDKAIR